MGKDNFYVCAGCGSNDMVLYNTKYEDPNTNIDYYRCNFCLKITQVRKIKVSNQPKTEEEKHN